MAETQTLAGTITRVAGRKVPSPYGEGTLYQVFFRDALGTDRVFGTFKEDFATDAKKHEGITGIQIEVEKSGDFWNFNRVVSSNGNAPVAPSQASTVIEVESPRLDAKTLDIHRQVAFKVAVNALAAGVSIEDLHQYATSVERLLNTQDLSVVETEPPTAEEWGTT